jgi:predicted DNA-binding protein (UPF0251 family)
MYVEIAEGLEFNDRLDSKIDLEMAVKEIELTDMERQVLTVVGYGWSNNQGSSSLGISKRRYNRLLNSAAHKIKEYLGEEYSDEILMKLIERKIKRELTPRERRQVQVFLAYGVGSSKGIIQ